MKLLTCFSIISPDLIDISEGIRLFNDADFFSSHDFFETCWMECDRADKLFFQGMVQISVGCYHLISGNKNGCLSQLKKGKSKLKNYLPYYMNINIESLLNRVEQIIAELDEISPDKELVKLWKKIPILEIKN